MTKLIIIHSDLTQSFGREITNGILNYRFNRGKFDWEFQFCHSVPPSDDELAGRIPDGIIAPMYSTEIESHVVGFGIPCVNITAPFENSTMPSVTFDNQEIGRQAAYHLLERGIDQAFYLSSSLEGFSLLRYSGWKQIMEQHGIAVSCYDYSGWKLSLRNDIKAYLGTFDHEATGVYTVHDAAGLETLEACRQLGLKVPEQVCVIGTNNDDVLCRLASPELSSIELNGEEVGFRAAEALDALMAGEAVTLSTVVPVKGVVSRHSTDRLTVSDRFVANALRFIRSYACSGIDVSDVLKQVPLSRRALEYRFKAETGQGIYQFIQEIRLAEAQKMLLETNRTIDAIATATGFHSPSRLQVTFKKILGITPGKFRRHCV